MTKYIPPNNYRIEDEMVYKPNSNRQWVCFDDTDALIEELNKLYKKNAALMDFVKDFNHSMIEDNYDDYVLTGLLNRAEKLIK